MNQQHIMNILDGHGIQHSIDDETNEIVVVDYKMLNGIETFDLVYIDETWTINQVYEWLGY